MELLSIPTIPYLLLIVNSDAFADIISKLHYIHFDTIKMVASVIFRPLKAVMH